MFIHKYTTCIKDWLKQHVSLPAAMALLKSTGRENVDTVMMVVASNASIKMIIS